MRYDVPDGVGNLISLVYRGDLMQQEITTLESLDARMRSEGYRSMLSSIPEEERAEAGLYIYKHKYKKQHKHIRVRSCGGWLYIESEETIHD